MSTRRHLISFFLLLAVCVLACAAALNERPIIGILTQPVLPGKPYYGKAYLQTTYVQWVESAGSRVVPIHFNSTRSELAQLFAQVNGIILTGGGQTLSKGSKFFDAAHYLYELAIQANQRGDYFPIWGTCQGFQLLAMLTSGANDESEVLGNFNSWDYSWHLDFTPESKTSKMFGNPLAYPEIVNYFAKLPITMNYHHQGVSPATFNSYEQLRNFYSILSTNVDVDGLEFISTMEAKNYPFYGTQWHPEIPIFSRSLDIPAADSYATILANRYPAEFFVQEARKNMHSFVSRKVEHDSLIYNYTPLLVSGDQYYYFDISK